MPRPSHLSQNKPTRHDDLTRRHAHRAYHRQPQQPHRTPAVPKPTILVVAEETLRLHLHALLSNHGYLVYAATEILTAHALFPIAPIDIVLLHHGPETDGGGWDMYTQLRQSTTKPVLAIANITTDHFEANGEHMDAQTARADLRNYLKSIAFLCRTLIG